MPLDTYAHYNGTQPTGIPGSMEELRLSLIGNEDLKRKCLEDSEFLSWFAGSLNEDIGEFCHDFKRGTDVAVKLVILRILSTFAGDYALSETGKTDDFLPRVSFSVPALSRFVGAAVGYIPGVIDDIDDIDDTGHDILFHAINDALHVLVVVCPRTKTETPSDTYEVLWKLMLLLVAAHSLGKATSLVHRCMTSSLRLIPMCLNDGAKEEMSQFAIILLTMLLNALTSVFGKLYDQLFDDPPPSVSDLSLYEQPHRQLAADRSIALATAANLDLLTAVAVSACQIYNFFFRESATLVANLSPSFCGSSKVFIVAELLFRADGNSVLSIAALNLVGVFFSDTSTAGTGEGKSIDGETNSKNRDVGKINSNNRDVGEINSKTQDLSEINSKSAGLNSNAAPADASASSVVSAYERLLPRIIELLDEDVIQKRHVPPFLQLPVSVMSSLCLLHPRICLSLTNTNVDHRVMTELERLCSTVPVFCELHRLKTALAQKTQLADFTPFRRLTPHAKAPYDSAAQLFHLDMVAEYLLLLSVYTSSNDDLRRRVVQSCKPQTPNFLCFMVFELMDDYRFLTLQLTLCYRVYSMMREEAADGEKTQGAEPHIPRLKDPAFMAWFASNLGVLCSLVEHPVFTHTMYLIRSLSRSVATLRTFFVDCNSIRSVFDVEDDAPPAGGDDPSLHEAAPPAAAAGEEIPPGANIVEVVGARYNREASFKRKGSFVSSLLEVLNQLEPVNVALQYFDGARRTPLDRKGICVKKVILLATIANFILDFSSFRYEIVNHDTFVVDLAAVFRAAPATAVSRDVAYERLREQLAVLQVIKNYLYNENEENRKFLWELIPLLLIYEKSLYGVAVPPEEDLELHGLLMQHKVIAFAIMRNLTAASAFFSEAIKETYLEYVHQEKQGGRHFAPPTWTDFLLRNMLRFDLFLPPTELELRRSERDFFTDDEFFFTLLKDPDYVRMVVDINYMEEHRYTNIPVFRHMDFPLSAVLAIWKRMLLAELLERLECRLCGDDGSINQKVRLASLLIELKTSICWILINLTWKDDEYGYHVPDKVNFRLLDTVSFGHSDMRDHGMYDGGNVAIEESEDEEGGEGAAHSAASELHDAAARAAQHTEAAHESPPEFSPDDDSLMSPEERAKALHTNGFSAILQRVIYEMARPKARRRSASKSNLALERFDNVNANDLYEKCKTAYFQITSLANNRRGGSVFAADMRRPSHHEPPQPPDHSDPRREDSDDDVDIDDYWVR